MTPNSPSSRNIVARHTHRRIFCLLAAMLGLGLGGCRAQRDRTVLFNQRQRDHVRAPIDVTLFGGNDAIRRQVLTMPMREIADRFGAMQVDVQSIFSLENRQATHEQDDRYQVASDSHGNFHAVITTPNRETETYVIDETVYVRYDKGELRRKTRRDMNVDGVADLAAVVLPQALALFGNLSFVDAQTDNIDGHPATRYRIRLEPNGPRDLNISNDVFAPAWQVPLRPPPPFRAASTPTQASGTISLDNASGAILRANFDGKLEFTDAKLPNTHIGVHVRYGVTNINRVAPIHAPRWVPEAHRTARARDPLAFFRDYLPRAEPSK